MAREHEQIVYDYCRCSRFNVRRRFRIVNKCIVNSIIPIVFAVFTYSNWKMSYACQLQIGRLYRKNIRFIRMINTCWSATCGRRLDYTFDTEPRVRRTAIDARNS